MGRITTFRAWAVASLIGLALLPVPPRASLATFAGDPVIVGAADIASCSGSGDEATANLIEAIPGTVMVAGDLAYPNGTASEFKDCYGPSWGRFRNRTRPAPGNRDYYTDDAGPYFDYFGSAAGTRGQGWYSYDLGSWHVVVLNSNCSRVGCSAGSPQERWLRADLATAGGRCTLAYFHHPLFASLDNGAAAVKPIWQALHDHHASVVVNGHIHGYERFAPQDPSGKASANGIREFIVGTGGASLISSSRPANPNSEARDNQTRGVLKLTLRPASYDWQFIPIAGKSFTDSGSAPCSGSGGGGVPVPEAVSRTFEPGADATVFANDPNANAGRSSSLIADAKPESRAYLRLDVSGLAGTVRRATLRLYVTDGSKDGPAVYPAASNWSETDVTWNGHPARLGALLADLGGVKKGQWVSLDVSAAVTGDGTYAFELAPTSEDGTDFSSRDAKSKRPQLVVETTVPPPTTSTSTSTTTSTTTTTDPPETNPPGTEPPGTEPPGTPAEEAPSADQTG
jgi:calcineurin-like phosphoesterase family protein